METIMRNVITLSISFSGDYDKCFEYLSNPLNQKEWAIHFVLDVEAINEGYIATLPFGTLPMRIDADHQSGLLDIYIGDGKPTRTRLIGIEPGFCVYNFTLVQPKEMPKEVWESQGLPNMKEELNLLKSKLEAL